MATVRPAPPVRGEVPAELLDPQDGTWRDVAAFRGWCQRYDLDSTVTRLSTVTWFDRFTAGRDRWALTNGFDIGDRVDHVRLGDAGVPYVGSLSRAAARAEIQADDAAEFRKSCRLESYGGPVVEKYPGSGPLNSSEQ